MRRRSVGAALVALALGSAVSSTAGYAFADGLITVVDGNGSVGTTIYIPGSPGTKNPIIQGPAGSTSNGPAVTCTYQLDYSNPASHPGDYPGLHDPGHVSGTDGDYYYRGCADGTQGIVWVPNGQPHVGAPAHTATPEELALEARNRLVLAHPTVHRSPTESNDYQGNHFTWANLSTWFWTDAADYRPESQTVSVGPVSATVVAEPIGLLFDPGDGDDAVRCSGPGRPWTDADGNDAPASGCGYQYRHVTDGAVTSRLGILWRVTWTGTGGTGGTLPTMETITAAPLRVLQMQVVNR